MKALLIAAKNKLQIDIDYIKNRDVYVTENIRIIRESGGYPAIGLKDGSTGFVVESGDQIEKSLTIQAVCYVKLYKPEAALMGDYSTDEKGLLDIADNVIAALDTTFDGAFDTVTPVSIGESELLIDEGQAIQMLPITLRYTK